MAKVAQKARSLRDAPPWRVLHLIDTWGAGGAEAMLVNLAGALPRRDYPSLALLRQEGWLSEQLRAGGIEVIIHGVRPGLDLRFIRWLRRFIADQGVDLVHAHMLGMNLYGSAAARMAGVPCVATVHGRTYDLERSRRVFAYSVIGRLASQVVAVSESVARELSARSRIPSRKVEVIPNGIDIGRFAPERARDPHAAPVAITVGRLAVVKGHELLIEAAVALRQRFPGCRLLVVGDGPSRQTLERAAQRAGVDGTVVFMGFRSDVPDLLRQADVFVLPSHSEGLSLALLEAMAAGLPVIATEVGGNPELVNEQVTGLLAPPGDAVALADRIGWVWTHPLQAGEMGRAARRFVEDGFSLEVMRRRYLDLYQRLLVMNRARNGRGEPD